MKRKVLGVVVSGPDHAAIYRRRIEKDPDYFNAARRRREMDRKYVGGYVGEDLAEALRAASRERGATQTDIIAMALRKELFGD